MNEWMDRYWFPTYNVLVTPLYGTLTFQTVQTSEIYLMNKVKCPSNLGCI